MKQLKNNALLLLLLPKIKRLETAVGCSPLKLPMNVQRAKRMLCWREEERDPPWWVGLSSNYRDVDVTIQLVDTSSCESFSKYACFGSTFEDFGQLSPFGCYGFQGRCSAHVLGLALVEGRARHDWTDLPQLRRD